MKVANSLSLTPQLQQVIRLLQFSSLELEQEIQIQLNSNPLLEKIEDEGSTESLTHLESDDTNDLTQDLNVDHLPNDLPLDTDWDDVYTHHPLSEDDEERYFPKLVHLASLGDVEQVEQLLAEGINPNQTIVYK